MTLNNKTPEEILKENWHKVTDRPFGEMELQHLNYAIKAMQEYADQEKRKAFNEALDLAADKADTIGQHGCYDQGSMCDDVIVDKQSILSLKIK